MLFRHTFEPIPALHYVYEHLQLTSNLGRHYLLELPFCNDAALLEREFNLLEKTLALVQDDNYRTKLQHIRNHLHQINDIRPTLDDLFLLAVDRILTLGQPTTKIHPYN